MSDRSSTSRDRPGQRPETHGEADQDEGLARYTPLEKPVRMAIERDNALALFPRLKTV